MAQHIARLLLQGRECEALTLIPDAEGLCAVDAKTGRTLLHAAVLGSAARAIEALLAAGGPGLDPGLRDRGGRTAVDLALRLGDRGCAHALLRAGLLGSAAAAETVAAALPTRAVLELVLRFGGNVNARAELGTPVHYALRFGGYDVLEFLVEELPALDWEAGDTGGLNPVWLAATLDRPAELALLLRKAAEEASPASLRRAACATDAQGNTLAHFLAEKGRSELLQLLANCALAIGLDLRAVNSQGLTSADLAALAEERLKCKAAEQQREDARRSAAKRSKVAVERKRRSKFALQQIASSFYAHRCTPAPERASLLLMLVLVAFLLTFLRWQIS